MGRLSQMHFGIAGLSTGQFWIVFIIAQIGLLLWLGRRASASAGEAQSRPSNPIEKDLTEAQWKARMIEHRIKQLKTQSLAQLQKIPASAIERVRSYGGWWTRMHVTREARPDGQLLITVREVGENGFPVPGGGKASFLANPNGSTKDVEG